MQETKTQLSQIKLSGNRLVVDLLLFDGRILNTVVDGLATKQAKKWLAARSHFMKLKKWAFVNPTKQEAAEAEVLNQEAKTKRCFLHRTVYRLTLFNN